MGFLMHNLNDIVHEHKNKGVNNLGKKVTQNPAAKYSSYYAQQDR